MLANKQMPRKPVVISVFDLEAKKYGSMEEYAIFLSRALKARGWSNILVFVRSVSQEILKVLTDAGAIVEVMQRSGQPGCYKELMRILWRHRGDIVHYHFLEHFSLLPIMGWLPRPQLQVFTDHFRQPQPIGWVTRAQCIFWDRLIIPLLGVQILAVSEHVKNTLVECYGMKPHRIRVIANGVNLERFTPVDPAVRCEIRNELALPRDVALVVCASNLRPEKGISDLLAAAERVVADKPDTLFVVVGEGPLSQRLRQEAVERGIQQHVRFTGVRSDTHRFIAAGDVVVVPSVWQEPAGLVVIEGMAAGRPVVATRVGGIPEYLIEGVTGILVEPHAPDQLAQALLRLLRAPAEAEAMGRAGRARAETCFSMERWIRETEQIYQTALNSR
jgi:glycosyltransferase involved in cell wall biosynthesis